MINTEIVSYIKAQEGKGVPRDVIEKNLVGVGWSPADVSEAFTFISNIAVASTPPAAPSNVPLSPGKTPHHRFALPITILVILVVLAGGIFAYIKKIGPFSSASMYTEATLLSGVLDKSESINTSSYSVSGSLNVGPRDKGAMPFVLERSDEDFLEKYQNDVDRSKDVQNILSALRYSGQKEYPASLSALKSNKNLYYYSNFSTEDPATSEPYKYKITDGGKNFTLEVAFETPDAITQIRRGYRFIKSNTSIEGKKVAFTKDSESYFFLSTTPPKPLLATFAESAQYLPGEMKVDMTLSAKADWQPEASPDWAFNIDANGDFGDLQYKVNIDALKKNKDYYFKINNIPSLFLGMLSNAKGVWVKISPEEKGDDYSYNPLSSIALGLPKQEESYKEWRAEVVNLLHMAVKFADEEKLMSFKKKPSAEKIDGRTLYRHELDMKKEKILPFYEKLLAEAQKSEIKNYLFEDSGFVEYLKSEEFDAVFDYYQKNIFVTLWTDAKGFPAMFEYRFRIVPSDEVEQMKDKQINLAIVLKISDINKPIVIETPSGAKSLDEIGGTVLDVARNKGANASIKANISNMRSSAELYYDAQGSYGKASSGNCEAAGTIFSDKFMAGSISGIKETLKGRAEPASVVCYSSPKAWAFSANLIEVDKEKGYWCVDSTGASKLITKPISSTSCK